MPTFPSIASTSSSLLQKASTLARSTGSGSTFVHFEGLTLVTSLAQIGAHLFAVSRYLSFGGRGFTPHDTRHHLGNPLLRLLESFVRHSGWITTGAGEKQSTPDITNAYEVIGCGVEAENRAMVYAGYHSP